MKMAAGSENDSDDQSESSTVIRTPALQINDDNFIASGGSDPKKIKMSPVKAKTPNNSKSNSPSKTKKTAATTAIVITPSKTKSAPSANKK